MRPQTDWDSALDALADGATLITANARLARRALGEEAARRHAAGERVWRRGDILPWTGWLKRLHTDALAHGAIRTREAAVLLTEAQAEVLWQTIITADPADRGLLQPAAAARQALEAYTLCRAWRIDERAIAAEPHPEDPAAYLRWSAVFERRLRRRRWLLAAQLPECIPAWLERVPALRPRGPVLLAGFQELSPQQQALAAALGSLDIEVAEVVVRAPAGAAATRVGCADAEAEMAAAAGWSRRLLARNPRAHIGIVVHDLARQRSALTRRLDAVLDPGARGEITRGRPRAWNVSLGRPLAEEPLIHDALAVIRAAGGRLEFEAASRLLRSPFLAGAESERGARLALEVSLRERGDVEIRTAALARLARDPDIGCGKLADAVEGLLTLSVGWTARRSPAEWAGHFAALLEAVGWPGERSLDSHEYQALGAWHELLRELASLATVAPKVGRGQVLERLRRLATARLFQPRAAPAPVQVLGLLEALGQRFDALWIMGLHDEAWPEAPRPNPFLPVELQRRLGLPHASAARELEFAERLTARLLETAPEVVVSWPRRVDDRALRPSPLIMQLPEAGHEPPASIDDRGRLLASARFETVPDARGPDLLPYESVRGGTALFRDQSQCPFRAFAIHRLQARRLERPGPGLDAGQRGVLVHRILERLWAVLETRATLAALEPGERERCVAESVGAEIERMARRHPTVFTQRFTEVERQRLERLMHEWLASEVEREDFRVIARELPVRINIGFLTVRGRLDRVDERMDGRRVLVDYKTGDTDPNKWLGDPLEEPQLPLYTLDYGDGLAGVLMARVRAGRCGWTGVTRDDAPEPGARVISEWRKADGADWAELRRQWQVMAERLAAAIMAGCAEAEPLPQACQQCHLKALCRIDELRGRQPPHAHPARADE